MGGRREHRPFRRRGTGKPNTSFPVNASAKLLWDDKNLYVLVQVQEADSVHGFTDAKSQPTTSRPRGQPKLWTTTRSR